MEATLSIGEVAARSGLRPSAIRYYEERGLLPEPERASGRRRYREEALTALALIEVAKEAGLTLAEIRELVAAKAPSAAWQALAEAKLRAVDELIARAHAMRAVLERGLECGCIDLAQCELLPPVARTTDVST